MASRLIGRAQCPECGFAAAHVKESDKCTYRYCPECGSQHHARTDRQKSDLLKKTRLIESVSAAAEPVAVLPTPSEPTPTQEATPPPPKRRGLFS